MTTRWPDRLPLPTLEGYGVQPGEAVLRTEMEAGPARQRRRFTDVPSRIAVRWVLQPDQFALFEAWYRWARPRAAPGSRWTCWAVSACCRRKPASPASSTPALARPALGGNQRA